MNEILKNSVNFIQGNSVVNSAAMYYGRDEDKVCSKFKMEWE